MPDGRDAVRRYLEQRLELGESSIVLESMLASEVVAAKPVARAESGRAAATRTNERAHIPDWRTALQESGAEPMAQKSGRAQPPSSKPVKEPAAAIGKTTGNAPVDPDSPLPPLESLAEIATTVAACTRCALYATATNPVPGEGDPNADFVVVGEAPGATEDETGRPFVGAAGKLLTQILEAIQLKREDVFICNVLKHRPPGNRNPEPNEVRACSPYLIRQIELIKPKVILALGTFSAQTLLETRITIGKLRGQIHQFHGVPVVVTYHPAALLRNPAWKRPTWEDVQLARRILDSAVPGA